MVRTMVREVAVDALDGPRGRAHSRARYGPLQERAGEPHLDPLVELDREGCAVLGGHGGGQRRKLGTSRSSSGSTASLMTTRGVVRKISSSSSSSGTAATDGA